MVRIQVCYRTTKFNLEIGDMASCTVQNVKEMSSQHMPKLAVEHMRVLWRGKPLEDAQTLHAAGLKNYSKLVIAESPEYVAARSQLLDEQRAQAAAEQARKHEAAAAAKREAEAAAEQERVMGPILKVEAEVAAIAAEIASLREAQAAGNPPSELAVKKCTELLTRHQIDMDALQPDPQARLKRKEIYKQIDVLCQDAEAVLKGQVS